MGGRGVGWGDVGETSKKFRIKSREISGKIPENLVRVQLI